MNSLSISAELRKAMSVAKADAIAPKPQLADMLLVLMEQAADIECMQLRLLLTGDRTEPYAPAMRKMAVLDACAGFLRACIDRPDEVAKRLTSKRSGGAT
jgi:hypothetical protein